MTTTVISPTNHNLADYDVQMTMNALLQEFPGEIHPHHVKGHKDTKQGLSQSSPMTQHKKKSLSWEAKLN
eukprot:908709-Ditylum_brightwellii.AAC.1